MKKKSINRKLSIEKLTIAKLSNTRTINGGSNHHCNEVLPSNEISVCIGCDDPLTAIGPTQTINQGPTKVFKISG